MRREVNSSRATPRVRPIMMEWEAIPASRTRVDRVASWEVRRREWMWESWACVGEWLWIGCGSWSESEVMVGRDAPSSRTLRVWVPWAALYDEKDNDH